MVENTEDMIIRVIVLIRECDIIHTLSDSSSGGRIYFASD